MKVIAINGSPHADGNTSIVLAEMAKVLQSEGIEVETMHIGGAAIHGCIACNYCWEEGHRCVFKDDPVNEISEKIEHADGVILASPTYFSAIAGTMKSFLDRLFYSGGTFLKYKVATVAAITRRAGAVLTANQMKNYLDLAEAITPPSQYWEVVYGMARGEVLQDAEGMQTARKNARAMAWLMKVVAEGREKYPLPEDENRVFTNFIR